MKGVGGDCSLLEGVGMIVMLEIILFTGVGNGTSKDDKDVVMDVLIEVFAVCSCSVLFRVMI